MTGEDFEEKMHDVLAKAGEACNLCLDWCVVSSDPDRIADFGVNYDGNLVIDEQAFPIKLDEITSIQYKADGNTMDRYWYFRFNWGKDSYLNCLFDDCSMGEKYELVYKGQYDSTGSGKEIAAKLKRHIDADRVAARS